MEATGTYHRKAADYFCSNGYTVHVVNPLKIKRYSGVKFLRAKTDKIDSKIIALYGFNEKEPVYKLKPEKHLKIQGFLNAIDDLCQMDSWHRGLGLMLALHLLVEPCRRRHHLSEC